MEQQQRSLIFTAAVGLIILAIVVGSIYYLVKFIQTRVSSSRQTPVASVEELVEASPEAEIVGDQTQQVVDTNPVQIPEPSTTQPRPVASAQRSTAPVAQTSVSKGGIVASSDKKVFDGGNFKVSYLKNWGLLTCANSRNFELDPLSPTDSRISCNYATKPITILVGDNWGCSGDAGKLGNVSLTKSVRSEAGYTKYQWCTQTNPVLNITHRVSQGNDPASSKQDYSKQIEEMISQLTFSRP